VRVDTNELSIPLNRSARAERTDDYLPGSRTGCLLARQPGAGEQVSADSEKLPWLSGLVPRALCRAGAGCSAARGPE